MLSASTDFITPKNKLCLYILLLLSVPYTRPKLEEFVSFYDEFVAKNEELENVLYKWIKSAGNICAFPNSLVIMLQQNRSKISLHVNDLYTVSEKGLRELYPVINKRRASKKQIIFRAKLVQKSMEEKKFVDNDPILQRLFDEPWNLQPDVISEFDKLLDTALDNSASYPKSIRFLVSQLLRRFIKVGINEPFADTYQISHQISFSRVSPDISTFKDQSALYYKLLRLISKRASIFLFQVLESIQEALT